MIDVKDRMPPQKIVSNLTDCIAEKIRLQKLSDKQLIYELIKSPASDFLIVQETMDRLLPGWEDIKTKMP